MGPVKEFIIKGKDVDISKLPDPIYSAPDSGPYLTGGVELVNILKQVYGISQETGEKSKVRTEQPYWPENIGTLARMRADRDV